MERMEGMQGHPEDKEGWRECEDTGEIRRWMKGAPDPGDEEGWREHGEHQGEEWRGHREGQERPPS